MFRHYNDPYKSALRRRRAQAEAAIINEGIVAIPAIVPHRGFEEPLDRLLLCMVVVLALWRMVNQALLEYLIDTMQI